MKILLRYAIIVSLAGAAALSGIYWRHTSRVALAEDPRMSAPYTTWRSYQGGLDSAQYSALKQIDRSNVAKLRQVWFYPAGNNGFRYGSNPIVIDNVMYVIAKDNNLSLIHI